MAPQGIGFLFTTPRLIRASVVILRRVIENTTTQRGRMHRAALYTRLVRVTPARINRFLPHSSDVSDHLGGVEQTTIGCFVYEFKRCEGGIISKNVSRLAADKQR